MAQLAETEKDPEEFQPPSPEEMAQLMQTSPDIAGELVSAYGGGPPINVAQGVPAAPPTGGTPAAKQQQLLLDSYAKIFNDLIARQKASEAAQLESKKNLEEAITGTAPQRQAATEAAQAAGDVARRVMEQKAPTLPEPPRMKEFLNRDVAQNMLMLGTLIGGINANGSIRSIRANKALAAATDGFMEGNFFIAKLGLEDWKNQMEKQKTEFEMIRQNNKDILEASGKSLEAKKFELEMALAPFGMKEKIYQNERTFIADAVRLDHELAGINTAMAHTIEALDPTLKGINLEIQRVKLEQERVQLAQLQAGGGKNVSTEEYKLMLQARAGGRTTGNPLVDKLTPEEAQQQLAKGTGSEQTQRRLELSRLLTSWEKERDALEKTWFKSPEQNEQLEALKAKIQAARTELETGLPESRQAKPAGTPTPATPATPPAVGTQAAVAGRPAPQKPPPGISPENTLFVQLKRDKNRKGWIRPDEWDDRIYEAGKR